MKAEAIENNGGGLSLYIWDDNGKLVYIHDTYEYMPAGSLLRDMLALSIDNDDYVNWDGNDIEDSDYQPTSQCTVIAEIDDDGLKIYANRMGRAGEDAFRFKI